MKDPKTLQEAIIYFADFENCQKFIRELRWEGGQVRCPHCGSEKGSYLSAARVYKCYGSHPKAKFSLRVGTIMEDSALGIDKWLTAMWLIVNCKNGVSSCEIARDLKITQKSAWHMAHRIRFALHRGSFAKLSGQFEAEETFIGGKARRICTRRSGNVASPAPAPGQKTKQPSMGILERGGEVRTMVVLESQTERAPN